MNIASQIQIPIVIAMLSITVAAIADDEAVFSGPQKGEPLPQINVLLAYGVDRGQEIDVVSASEGKPTLLVLVNGANRPAARLTRVLMNYAEMRTEEELFAAVVWLDGDRSAAEQYLQQAISWWGMGRPVGISLDGAEGPGSYGLNRDVNLTILIANENRVIANYALVQPSETDAPKILQDVVKLIGGRIPSHPEIVFLSMPTRAPETANWTAAIADPKYRWHICRVLGSKDDAEAKQAAAALKVFVADNVDRQRALARTAEALSRGRTAIRQQPAARYIRRWLPQQGANDRSASK